MRGLHSAANPTMQPNRRVSYLRKFILFPGDPIFVGSRSNSTGILQFLSWDPGIEAPVDEPLDRGASRRTETCFKRDAYNTCELQRIAS